MVRNRHSRLGTVYPDGATIVRQGDDGDCMYVIQEGRVEVVHGHDNGEVHLGFMEAGEFFGEMALFRRESRSATVRARGEARVLTVDKKTLLRRIKEDPLLAYDLVETLSRRIAELHAKLASWDEEGEAS